MSDATTKRMIRAYIQTAAPTMWFSGLFQTPAVNYYNSEKVEFDIERDDEDISVVVQDIKAGYRYNSTDIYTNKELLAPVHKEAVTLNSFELQKRQPGQDPFQNPDFRENIIQKMFRDMRRIERKIRRSIELQAAQILTTGTVTLRDENGNALYTIDFSPKATHFPDVATAWSDPAATPFSDIISLANVIRNDGLNDPDELHFGEQAFENFITNDTVLNRQDNRRIEMGVIQPEMRGNGGTYMGTMRIGHYNYKMFTYAGRYKDPQTGSKVKYLPDDLVVVRSSAGRLDATFGAIPNIGQELGLRPVLIPELPSRFANEAGGMDLFTNVWVSEDGEAIFGGIGARPLLIPTAIDTYGCLNTAP